MKYNNNAHSLLRMYVCITKCNKIGPCYAILGGYKKNEGGVITIGPDGTLEDFWEIPDALPLNSTVCV